MKSNNNNNNDDDDDDDNNTAMGSVHARGDTFLTFGLKALTETNTSRLATVFNFVKTVMFEMYFNLKMLVQTLLKTIHSILLTIKLLIQCKHVKMKYWYVYNESVAFLHNLSEK
jgi:hypothetical protein